MAITFAVRLARPPTPDELAAILDEPLLEGIEGVPAPWPEGEFAHLHVPGVSTRGLEIGPEHGLFTVRVLSSAAPEELAMGVRLVAGLARREGCTIQRDGSGDLDADTFEATFDAAWIAATVDEDFAKLRQLASDRLISLPGPTRRVTFGPTVLARLPGGTEPLLRLMRDVLYPNGPFEEDDGLYVSHGIGLTRDGREIVVHTLAPGVNYFFTACDVYALMDAPPLHIPSTELARLAPEHVTPVDETCVRLRAFEEEEWAELLDRARAVGHVDAFEAAPPADRARPAGTLLPLLRPPTWRGREVSVSRSLLKSPTAVPHMPLVTIVVDTPVATASMPTEGWDGPDTATPELAEANAVKNLEALDLPLQEEVVDGKLRLTVVGEYAAELILSKRRLDEVHAKLGAIVVAAVPVRGLVRFQRGDDMAGIGDLVAWARSCFEDAGRRAQGQPGLTPLCFGIVGGKVTALVQAAEKATGPATEAVTDGAGVAAAAAPAGRSAAMIAVGVLGAVAVAVVAWIVLT